MSVCSWRAGCGSVGLAKVTDLMTRLTRPLEPDTGLLRVLGAHVSGIGLKWARTTPPHLLHTFRSRKPPDALFRTCNDGPLLPPTPGPSMLPWRRELKGGPDERAAR